MIEDYIIIKEIAEQWGITPRRVQVLCNKVRIPGAVKLGKVWTIPKNAERPEDGRAITGGYKNWRNKKDKM